MAATTNTPFINFSSRDWGYRGDKGTWVRQNDDGTYTLKVAARGTLSRGYTEELREFCAKYGQDFDAIRCGESITFAPVEAAQETTQEEEDMSEISLDNGINFMSAHEAMEQIESLGLWDVIVEAMNDEIREKVHAELAPCTELEFLRRYLELSPEDLVIG